MTTMNIENQVCDAIQILAEKAINQAPYDKTISALIVECVDTAKGKYKVKYQDALYYATSDNTELTYRKNTEVYILVPGNDFSKEKKILGTVKDMEAEYNDRFNNYLNSYYEVGESLLFEGGSLCSYLINDEEILIGTETKAKKPPITIQQSFSDNLKLTDSKLRLSAEIKTALPQEHRGKGDYGIFIAMTFDGEEEKGNLYTFTLDIDKMEGQPYNYGDFTSQRLDFDLGGRMPKTIEKVRIFSKNFVDKNTTGKKDNIFIQNIKLTCLASKDERYLDIKGSKFNILNKTEELSFEAVPMIGDRKFVSEDTKFYWFSEDDSIRETTSPDYSTHGGKGWYWLNKDDDTNNVLKISHATQPAKTLKYKCVCVMSDATVLEEEFTIENYVSEWTVEMVSEPYGKTNFVLGRGKTDLLCDIIRYPNQTALSNATYYWSKVDNDNNLSFIYEDEEANELAASIDTFIAELEDDLNEGAKTLGENYTGLYGESFIEKLGIYDFNMGTPTIEEIYNLVLDFRDNIGITHLNKNRYYNVRPRDVIISNVFKCTVKNADNQVVGVGSIKLTNDMTVQGKNRLVINNGTQIFKYDENGLSPINSTTAPQEIKELSLTLYDVDNNIIEDLATVASKIEWTTPPQNESMILPSGSSEGEPHKFTFSIQSTFSPYKTNNVIKAEVVYKGELITAETDLIFVKDGSSGTNGTDYYCRIVPTNGRRFDGYPTITYYRNSGEYFLNAINNNDTKEQLPIGIGDAPFEVQLYNRGELIVQGVDSGVKWKTLVKIKNQNNQAIAYNIPLALNTNSGTIQTLDGTKLGDNYLGVIQAEVSYDGKKFFAELPIAFVRMRNLSLYNNYIVKIKNGTGFNEVVYASDGTNPRYSSGENFALSVVYKGSNGDNYIELTEAKSGYGECYPPLRYEWEVVGVDTDLLKITGNKNTDKPALRVSPARSYTGEYCDIGLKCNIYNKNDINIALMYFPIHFMLNKYGFAALNDWDGNGIEINEDGGYILAPQMGAGEKDNNNRFTGVLMGTMQEADGNKDIGLLGFNKGDRTIFLDAETGKAEFGRLGDGQIIIDPRIVDENGNTIKPKARIYSGNFYKPDGTEKGQGLLIDLTTPEIRFGNGNFSVNSEGKMSATEAKVSGAITATSLQLTPGAKSDVYTKNEIDKSFDALGEDIDKVQENLDNLDFTSTVEVSNVGKLGEYQTQTIIVKNRAGKEVAKYQTITNANSLIFDHPFGTATATDVIPGASTNQASGKGYVKLSKEGLLTAHNAFIYGDIYATNGYFAGELKATTGTIGGWAIDKHTLKSGKIILNSSDNTIKAGDNFSVSNTGSLVAKDGNIGGWDITSTRLLGEYVDGSTTYYNSFNRTGWAWAISIGSTDKGSSVGKFRVSQSGHMVAESGKIGNWTISDGAIGKGKTSLGADGSFTSGNFSVDASGNISATGGTFKNITVTGTSTFGSNCTFSGSLDAAGGTFKGTLSAAKGSFSGTITAGGGSKIGDWIIENGAIKSAAKNIQFISDGDNPRIICGETTLFDGGTIRTPYWQISPTKGMMIGDGSGVGSSYSQCPSFSMIINAKKDGESSSQVYQIVFKDGILKSMEPMT